MRRRNRAEKVVLAFAALALAAFSGCERDDTLTCDGDPPDITRPANWTRASHCRGVAPDYDEVFDDTVLHEFHIQITDADREATWDDVQNLVDDATDLEDLDALSAPIWVPATVTYDGRTWTQAGMRYKGHASLVGAWNQGMRKLSFLLDFDYFEETYPDLVDQRFFGFKGLVFGNAYNDPSVIREKVAAEVFRAAGVKVARSAFAPVYLDWGQAEGPQYLGMYTVIEDPSDAMLETQFGAHENGVGNLYKPWGETAARWVAPLSPDDGADGGLSDWQEDIEAHFEKATNDELADWSDIERVIEKLHGDRSVPAQWRAELEEAFDVQSFIKTLAVNQAIMNWDSYGCMHHNYYVYSNPLDHGRFVWFPWDMNEAMLESAPSYCPPPGSVMLDEIVKGGDPSIDANWPVIQFVLGDPEYCAAYVAELRVVLDGPFAQEPVVAMMRRYHDLVAPWVVGPTETEAYPYWGSNTGSGFAGSLAEDDGGLEPHVQARHAAVEAVLAGGDPCAQ
jgi:spore coat protein H